MTPRPLSDEELRILEWAAARGEHHANMSAALAELRHTRSIVVAARESLIRLKQNAERRYLDSCNARLALVAYADKEALDDIESELAQLDSLAIERNK